jgi:hypothetical protein
MQKTELCKLFELYKADKCDSILHSYSSEYYRLFEPIKNIVKNFMEIGIGNKKLMGPIVGKEYIPGASLRAWKDFFINAKIFGLDIDKDVLFEEDNIKCFYTDQSSAESLKNTLKLMSENIFDIIIDDGSHIKEHMTLSYEILIDYLNFGGFYIIEDIWLNDIEYFINLCNHKTTVEYVHKGNYDQDNFICYRKK